MLITGITFATILLWWFQGTNVTAGGTYLVDLPNCRIPEAPLFPDAVKQLWNAHFNPVCPALPTVGVVSADKVLTLNPASMASRNIIGCCYTEILRPHTLPGDGYTLSDCKKIPGPTPIHISEMEFFYINCTTQNASEHILEFHHNIPKSKPEIQEKLKFWAAKKEAEKPMNIMFVIIDSVDRAHALRSLPKTMDYLTNTTKFVDFKGYHCVGEPSSVNYIPMTMGVTIPDLILHRPLNGLYDDAPLIHKNFAQSNYLTMQIEDLANYGVFNFNGRKGFNQKPVDFYLRPYTLFREQKATNKDCVNDKHVYDFMLDYTLEFFETYPNIPKYTTIYLSWPCHDKFVGTKVMDNSFLSYFQKLEKMGAFKNTIMFVMADHGFRRAQIYSESKYGLLGRNLPMFLVNLPPSFIKKYPDTYPHLVTNAKKLTSHLDLFKTLVHLHQLMLGSGNSNTSYGYNMPSGRSLLKEIPGNRNCSDAKIPETFCSCNFPLFEDKFDYEKFKKPKTR